MQSKNAVGNLINRYRAVLKKCNLINTFGSLAMAGMLILGGSQLSQAKNLTTIDDLGDVGIKNIWRGIDPGDFDGNGVVNAEDKTQWNNNIDSLQLGAVSYVSIENSYDPSSFRTGIIREGSTVDETKAGYYKEIFGYSRDDLLNPVYNPKSPEYDSKLNPYDPTSSNYDPNRPIMLYPGEEGYDYEKPLSLKPTTYTFNLMGDTNLGDEDLVVFVLKDKDGNIITNTNNSKNNHIGAIEENFIGLIDGAIKNDSNSQLTSITGDFIGNGEDIEGSDVAGTLGGAISNINGSAIESITAKFIKNYAEKGGAIYNDNSTIGTITGSFIANESRESGASIYNTNKALIKTLRGHFQSNSLYCADNGGSTSLIYNNNSTIEHIIGDFTDTRVYMPADGALIHNNNAKIYTITSDIHDVTIDLSTYTYSDFDYKGGIYNNNSTIYAITGDLEYYTISYAKNTYGGYIHNNNKSTISALTGNHYYVSINNVKGETYGGYIYNNDSTFGSITGNFDSHEANISTNIYGSIIYNGANASMGPIRGNFTDNSITNSAGNAYGLIYNTGDSNIDAIIGNFEDNKIEKTAGNAYGLIFNTDASIGFISGSFLNNRIITLGGTAQGGAIWTNTDLNFKAVDKTHTFSGNYTSTDNDTTRDYNALYIAANAKTLAFNMEGTGDFVLNDSITTNGTDKYNLTITGQSAANNDFNLNNSLNNAGTVTVANATLQVGSHTHVKEDSAGNTVFSGSIGTANLTIQAGGGLVVKDSIKLDVSGGTLTVASDAASFSVSANGELVVQASNFGTFGDDGSFELTGGTVNKQLTNIGTLTLTGFSFNDMNSYEKALLLADTDFISLVSNVNNIKLDGVTIRELLSLSTVVDGTFGEVVLAGITDTTTNNTASFYGIVKNDAFTEKSKISAGDSITLTGEGSGNILYAVDAGTGLENSGILNLGKAGASYTSQFNGTLTTTSTGETNVLSAVIFNKTVSSSGTTTFNSTANFANGLRVTGGTSTFKESVTGSTYVDGGTLVIDAAGKTITAGDVGVTNGGLTIKAGILDATTGSFSVATTASNFATEAGGTLKMNASDFGTFAADGSFTKSSTSTINKLLDNAGNLTLTGDFTGMAGDPDSKKVYEAMLEGILTAVNSSGTITFEGLTMDNAYSLTNVHSSFAQGSVTAGTLDGNKNITVSAVKNNGTVINSIVKSGSTLNITGENNLLIEGNMTNDGTISLGTGEVQGEYRSSADSKTTITGNVDFNKTITLNGGTFTVDAAEKVVGTSHIHVDNGEFHVKAGELDTTGAEFTVEAVVTGFSIGEDGKITTEVCNFGSINQDGSFTAGDRIDKQLTNNGELVLVNVAFDEMTRAANVKLQNNTDWQNKITGDGSVILKNASGEEVKLVGLYSLSYVNEKDTAFQNGSQNIMAGDLTGTNRTVNAAGIEKTILETDPTKAISSTIAANNTLNLSGNNANNVLLDQGFLTNDGTLNLGMASAEYTANINGTLTIASTGTTNILSSVIAKQAITIHNAGVLDIQGGTFDVSAGLTADASGLSSAADTKLVVNNITIGADVSGIVTAANATVYGTTTNSLLGEVNIVGFTAGTELDYLTDYAALRTAAQTAYGTSAIINFEGVSAETANTSLSDVADEDDNTLGQNSVKQGEVTAGESATIGTITKDDTTPTAPAKNTDGTLKITGDSKDNSGTASEVGIETSSSTGTANTSIGNDTNESSVGGDVKTTANTGGTGTAKTDLNNVEVKGDVTTDGNNASSELKDTKVEENLEGTGGSTTKVTGDTEVAGTTKMQDSKLEIEDGGDFKTEKLNAINTKTNIGNTNAKATMSAETVETIKDSTILVDPAWIANQDYQSATTASVAAFNSFTSGIDGNLIAGRNGQVALGSSDINLLANDVIALEAVHGAQMWGSKGLTAALGIYNTQTLANTGSIYVDGSIYGASIGGVDDTPTKDGTNAFIPNANTAHFADNSLLVVDAKNVGNVAALTSTAGILEVKTGAVLVVAEGVAGSTITVVDGFTAATSNIESGAWGQGETLVKGKSDTIMTDSRAVGIGSIDWTGGAYKVNLIGLQVELPKVNQSVNDFLTEAGNVPLSATQKAFVDYVTNTGTDANQASATIQGSVQAVQTAGASSTGADVGNAVAQTLASRTNMSALGIEAEEGAALVLNNGELGMNAGDTLNKMTDGLAVWLMPIYEHSSVNGMKSDGFTSGYSTDLGGMALGADYTFDKYRLGLAINAGGGSTTSSGDFNESKNNFDFFGVSIYGGLRHNNFALNADFGYSRINNDISQDMPSASTLGSHSADVNTDVWTMGVNAEYLISTQYVDIIPHAGIRYMNIRTGSHSIDNGGSTLFNVKANSQDVWTFPLGVAFEKEYNLANGWELTPKADVGVVFAAGDLTSRTRASMPGVQSALEMEMQNIDSVAFNGGIGLDVASPSKNTTFSLNYNLQASEHETSHGLQATFRYEF